MTLSRLSIYNIDDPLKRVELYRQIQHAQDGTHSDFNPYEINLDEEYSPELVSYRAYGTKELKWAVAIAAGLDDWRDTIEPGVTIYLPSRVWVRERIKHYE